LNSGGADAKHLPSSLTARRPARLAWIGQGFLLLLAVGVLYILVTNFFKDPTLFVQFVLGGLQLGFVYALIALGYTMVYGIVRLINFAHGDVFMVGAFVSYYAVARFHFLPQMVPGHAARAGVLIGSVTVMLLSMLVCMAL
jgi:branched-chain amino acid transport system permease protein